MTDAEIPQKTYRGNCHCGAFVFELKSPELAKGSECNCSICSKKGYIWTRAGLDDFRVVKGDEKDLTAYTFGSGKFAHLVCARDSGSADSHTLIYVP